MQALPNPPLHSISWVSADPGIALKNRIPRGPLLVNPPSPAAIPNLGCAHGLRLQQAGGGRRGAGPPSSKGSHRAQEELFAGPQPRALAHTWRGQPGSIAADQRAGKTAVSARLPAPVRRSAMRDQNLVVHPAGWTYEARTHGQRADSGGGKGIKGRRVLRPPARAGHHCPAYGVGGS